jgi:hypothetical protein
MIFYYHREEALMAYTWEFTARLSDEKEPPLKELTGYFQRHVCRRELKKMQKRHPEFTFIVWHKDTKDGEWIEGE